MEIDRINLLPDSIANQIAAGEVIQRPASVVKELMENAIDALADDITVNIKDAGKTLIQVSDNGIGMSETDARMCFERHATSKIKDINDLFKIQTMGFRGEALASIASIAEVELKTRREEDEFGTRIIIEGSKLVLQEKISCPKGSNFSVKKLFYNVPARRKFLRKDTTEFNFIIHEFQKVAIAHPDKKFKLIHNDRVVYSLEKGNLARRLSEIFGEKIKKEILPLETKLPGLLHIFGYIGKPETAKKKSHQFFFVNKRFFRHSWFHKAIVESFQEMIKPETSPVYFIFFEIAPEKIYVNIHPTKTEIKFEDELNIRKALASAVKNTLFKYNIFPSINFDRIIDPTPHNTLQNTSIENKPDSSSQHKSHFNQNQSDKKKISPADIENFMHAVYEDDTSQPTQTNSLIIESAINEETIDTELPNEPEFILYRDRYILTEVKSGLLVIDAKKALEAINYKKALETAKNHNFKSQFVLQPIETEIFINNEALYKDFKESIKQLGFEIDEHKNEIIIKAFPPFLKDSEAKTIATDLYYMFEEGIETDDNDILTKKMAFQWAKTSASITNLADLTHDGIKSLVSSLFELPDHTKTITGEKIMDILPHNFISELFEK
jgi:DNA mismatch repair protein MutL